MGFSDSIAGLVDRLKPSNKSTSFSGIGSGNHGIISFEDNVSSLSSIYQQLTLHLSTVAPRLMVLHRR